MDRPVADQKKREAPLSLRGSTPLEVEMLIVDREAE